MLKEKLKTEIVRLYDFAKHLMFETVLFDDVHLNALNLVTRIDELEHQRETKIRKNIESFPIFDKLLIHSKLWKTYLISLRTNSKSPDEE
jgi:hypothetical protein